MAQKGVNKVILIGHACQDPEVKYMQNGNAVANLSIATNESWKDQQGQLQERAEFHRLTFYRKLAEIAGEYLRKGSQIYVEGKLQTRKWQDQQGQDRYTTEIIVDQMQMLGGKQDGQRNQQQSQWQRQQPQGYQQQARQQPQQQGNQQNNYRNNGNQNNQSQMPEPDFDFDDD